VREIAHQHQARVELGFSNVVHSSGTKVKIIFQLPESTKD